MPVNSTRATALREINPKSLLTRTRQKGVEENMKIKRKPQDDQCDLLPFRTLKKQIVIGPAITINRIKLAESPCPRECSKPPMRVRPRLTE